MNEVYIVSGCRVPTGSFQGEYSKIPASELGSIVIGEAVKRARVQPDDVDMVIMGQVLTAGQGQNPARQAAVQAKIPYSTPAFTVNMLCGSSIKSVGLAYQGIKNGDYNVVVAGGQENMTLAPHATYIRSSKFGGTLLEDTLLKDGLTDAFHNVHMGVTSEHLAKTYRVSRPAQDRYAAESHRKANEAQANGHFDKELVAVLKDGEVLTAKDALRPSVTLDQLAKLPARFATESEEAPAGSVTAGNASPISDGAAALVLVSGKEATERRLQVLGRVVGVAESGLEPLRMGIGPVGAVKKVLKKAGWTVDEVDLFELNEAYAVASIVVEDELKVDGSRVNVSGGGLALGHPLGASGAKILVTLLHNLARLGKSKGVAAACIGGGQGIAIAVERV